MNNFIVSARKYRPHDFNSVIGQESITATLKNAIRNNHIAQAYLFCGPRGVGKTTCARIFAKTINCEQLSPEGEACNDCESCKTFNQSRAFNIHELDAASNNSVDDIRNLIDQVRVPPQVGKYSVYIIDEVHMLSPQAFNAFLKTLEEPPSHAVFIMATTEKHKILPTILSRCQIYDFKRIKVADAVQYLMDIAEKEKINHEKEALNVIALKADGAMRDALSIFDQVVSFSENNVTYDQVILNLNVLDYEYYFKLVDAFLAGNVSESLLIFDEVLDKGFDAHHFITGLSSHFRDLLVSSEPGTIKLMEVGDAIKKRYIEQSEKCSSLFIYKALSIINNCDLNYKSSNNKRLHVELALVALANLTESSKKKANEEGSNKLVEEGNNQRKSKSADDSNGSSQTIQNISNDSAVADKSFKKQSFSIKSALNNNSGVRNSAAQADDSLTDDAQEKAQGKPDEEKKNITFTQDELEKKWKELQHEYARSQPRLASIINAVNPFLQDNFVIEFHVENTLQAESIRSKQYELLDALRKALHNDKISFETMVKESNDEFKPYTSEDKYQHMKQKNENLELLKKKFNLDFE